MGRLGFLSRKEYDRLHKVIAVRFPEHLAEFVVSVHAGMRLGEPAVSTDLSNLQPRHCPARKARFPLPSFCARSGWREGRHRGSCTTGHGS
jgi:hypothetical protein